MDAATRRVDLELDRNVRAGVTNPEAHPEPEHVRALDGLRGLAVTMVMALHVFKANSNTPSRAINFIYAVIHSGWVGVDLFFVLSGFLITRILYRTQFDAHYLKNFYARRALRIFPLYFGVIALLVLLEPLLHLHLWKALPYYLTYTANLRTAGPIYFHNVPDNAWVISHFWSLQIEEQFYLVWPLLLAMCGRAEVLSSARSPAAPWRLRRAVISSSTLHNFPTNIGRTRSPPAGLTAC